MINLLIVVVAVVVFIDASEIKDKMINLSSDKVNSLLYEQKHQIFILYCKV